MATTSTSTSTSNPPGHDYPMPYASKDEVLAAAAECRVAEVVR